MQWIMGHFDECAVPAADAYVLFAVENSNQKTSADVSLLVIKCRNLLEHTQAFEIIEHPVTLSV